MRLYRLTSYHIQNKGVRPVSYYTLSHQSGTLIYPDIPPLTSDACACARRPSPVQLTRRGWWNWARSEAGHTCDHTGLTKVANAAACWPGEGTAAGAGAGGQTGAACGCGVCGDKKERYFTHIASRTGTVCETHCLSAGHRTSSVTQQERRVPSTCCQYHTTRTAVAASLQRAASPVSQPPVTFHSPCELHVATGGPMVLTTLPGLQ
jgi:hypothetical protein